MNFESANKDKQEKEATKNEDEIGATSAAASAYDPRSIQEKNDLGRLASNMVVQRLGFPDTGITYVNQSGKEKESTTFEKDKSVSSDSTFKDDTKTTQQNSGTVPVTTLVADGKIPRVTSTQHTDGTLSITNHDAHGIPIDSTRYNADRSKASETIFKNGVPSYTITFDKNGNMRDSQGLNVQLGSASTYFAKQMIPVIEELPAADRKLLADNSIYVSLSRSTSDYLWFRSALGETPRGYSKDQGWNDVGGVFVSGIFSSAAVVSEFRSGEKNSDFAGTVRHELGHGMDAALGNFWGNFSNTKEFRSAYETDIAKMSPESKVALRYYLQPGAAGKQETFAEIYSALNGTAEQSYGTKYALNNFPGVSKVVNERLRRLREDRPEKQDNFLSMVLKTLSSELSRL